MISLHCNAATGGATGTEVIYRGDTNRAFAALISKTVSNALGLRDRGAKVEADSQHKRLAVMSYQPCFLIEIGFIDNLKDAESLIDPQKRLDACIAIAELL
jgi:N-acetylmuramoyl-L-alanine amidase